MIIFFKIQVHVKDITKKSMKTNVFHVIYAIKPLNRLVVLKNMSATIIKLVIVRYFVKNLENPNQGKKLLQATNQINSYNVLIN